MRYNYDPHCEKKNEFFPGHLNHSYVFSVVRQPTYSLFCYHLVCKTGRVDGTGYTLMLINPRTPPDMDMLIEVINYIWQNLRCLATTH